MKPTDPLLIVGADGSIGRALAARLVSEGKPVIQTTRRLDTLSETRIFLDLTKEKEVEDWHPPCQVATAYLCAGVSSLEQCRTNPVQSVAVNVSNIVKLAKTLVASGTFVIFLSTNQVYDGSIPFRKAEEPVCPQTEYGRQKAEAERQILVLDNLVSVVRFTKVLNSNMPLFQRWIQALDNHQSIHPFSDMVMAPLPISFAVDVLNRQAEVRLPGIVQVSGEKDVSYLEVANYIAQQIGASLDLVQSLRSKEADLQIESVPLHTTLDTSQMRVELGLESPDVWSAIHSAFSKNIRNNDRPN
jgi:dTDP-4-dehydrorhamnose reductase